VDCDVLNDSDTDLKIVIYITGMVTVTNLPSRPAPVLARTVTSLSTLSGGRVILGIGAGAIWDMITKLGIPRLGGGALAPWCRSRSRMPVLARTATQAPTVPSTPSRRKSACPLWRPYSRSTCTITIRSDTSSPHLG
jgi:Luciferase-like monooxygenase